MFFDVFISLVSEQIIQENNLNSENFTKDLFLTNMLYKLRKYVIIYQEENDIFQKFLLKIFI